MRIKYNTTIYNRKYPDGKEKTCIAIGDKVEKPSYLGGNMKDYVFIKTKENKIHVIEKDRIISATDN